MGNIRGKGEGRRKSTNSLRVIRLFVSNGPNYTNFPDQPDRGWIKIVHLDFLKFFNSIKTVFFRPSRSFVHYERNKIALRNIIEITDVMDLFYFLIECTPDYFRRTRSHRLYLRDIKTLVYRERHGSYKDKNENFARLIPVI